MMVLSVWAGCAALHLHTRGGGPGLGEPAPDFHLRSHAGSDIVLSEIVGHGPTLLVFYEGSGSSHCNRQLNEINRNLGEFRRRGITIMAISSDSMETSAGFAAELRLGFPLLADSGLLTIQAYGIAREGKDVAVPSVFIVRSNGRIAWKYVAEAMGDRPSVRWLLYILDDLLGMSADAPQSGTTIPLKQLF